MGFKLHGILIMINWLEKTRKFRHDIYEITMILVAVWVGLIGFFIVKALENK